MSELQVVYETLMLSYEAYMTSKCELYGEQIAGSVNGEIVSETESDNPMDYVVSSETGSEARRALVEKKRRTIQRRCRRLRAKVLAQQRFLSCKVGKKISKILAEGNYGEICGRVNDRCRRYVKDRGTNIRWKCQLEVKSNLSEDPTTPRKGVQ